MRGQAIWAPYQPRADHPWELRWAAHLFRRAGFGGDANTLRQAVAEGPTKTIDRLLEPAADVEEFEATFDRFEKTAAAGNSTDMLRAWWLRRMIETPHPLLEKLTLFWHDHFAAANRHVSSPQLMARHIRTLRSGALGSYRTLLQSAVDDPALLLSLGAQQSRRARPAKNVARQLLASWGVGPDHFSSRDLHETARALTGRFVLQNQLRVLPREHDPDPKNVLGQTGNWNAEDVVRIVAAHPATSENLVRKLYAWLISETEQPSPAQLAPLVQKFGPQGQILPVVETMLRSEHFFSAHAYRQRIKSPVEWAVGLARSLERTPPTVQLGEQLADLGQSLYDPPTSSGFPRGTDWIQPLTLLGRWQVADQIAAAGPGDLKALADRLAGNQPGKQAAWLAELLLDGQLPAISPEEPANERAEEVVSRLVTLFTRQPEYQLA